MNQYTRRWKFSYATEVEAGMACGTSPTGAVLSERRITDLSEISTLQTSISSPWPSLSSCTFLLAYSVESPTSGIIGCDCKWFVVENLNLRSRVFRKKNWLPHVSVASTTFNETIGRQMLLVTVRQLVKIFQTFFYVTACFWSSHQNIALEGNANYVNLGLSGA